MLIVGELKKIYKWFPPQVIVGPQQSCSTAQSGTSLAASVAAGVIALTLEAK